MKKKWYFSSNIFIVSDKVITVYDLQEVYDFLIIKRNRAMNDTYSFWIFIDIDTVSIRIISCYIKYKLIILQLNESSIK